MGTTTFGGAISAAFTVPAGEDIIVTTNSGGPTVVTAPAASYACLDDFMTALMATLTAARPVTAGAWSITAAVGTAGATPLCTISVSAGTFTITWTSTNLRNLLGFTGSAIAAQTSSTGTLSVVGVWQPDSPLVPDARHRAAPRSTDARQSLSPTGVVFTHIGNSRYTHRNLRWSHCPLNKIWAGDELVSGESLQQFLEDTQWGSGHAWFGVGSKCQIISHDAYKIGEDDGIVNWWLTGFTSLQTIVTRASDGWDGLWSVAIPEFSSDGT